MRTLLLIALVVVAPRGVEAQPEPDKPADQAAPTTGGDAARLPAPAARTPAELRQICADAMNADPSFAEAIAKTVNAETVKQHVDAANVIARNERHVILAYAAMWLVSAGFVLFLWRRQQALKTEIAQLRHDLETAAK